MPSPTLEDGIKNSVHKAIQDVFCSKTAGEEQTIGLALRELAEQVESGLCKGFKCEWSQGKRFDCDKVIQPLTPLSFVKLHVVLEEEKTQT